MTAVAEGPCVRTTPPVMVLPSPETLRASAVWVTVANWARGLERLYGQVAICLPGASLTSSDQLALLQTPPQSSVGSPRRRLRVETELRTLAKDALLLRTRRRDGTRYRFPAGTPPLVWQHHDLLLDAGVDYARRTGAPLVQFVDALQVWEARRWGVHRYGWGNALERLAERPQLCAADLVACVSSGVAGAVLAAGVEETRVVVTPCTADPARFHPGVDGAAVRQRLGFSSQDVVIGWTGSFRRFHGLEHALCAVRAVARADGRVRVLLVGDGADRHRIAQTVRSLGLDAVTCMPGAVRHEEVPEHVAAMDITVVTAGDPDRFHYSPLKLREYLLAGKAVIAPAVGQPAEELTDDVHALLYAPRDQDDLQRCLARLVSDAELRARLGRSGRQRELDKNSIGNQLGQLLARLDAQPRSRSDAVRRNPVRRIAPSDASGRSRR